jgi:SAM-dependent methyltransferase
MKRDDSMNDQEMSVHDPALAPVASHEDYWFLTNTPPLPHIRLLNTVGAPSVENFYVAGEAGAHSVARHIPRGGTVLDMGCGPGRTARFLMLRDDIRYIGFDIFKPGIDWANQFLAPHAKGRFRFEHFDAYSEHYNPRGSMRATQVRFPAADASIDVAFAMSLFTHLLEPDTHHYLRESARVLKPSGLFIPSIHVEPAPGHRYSGREDRIDIDKGYFVELAQDAGFALREDMGTVCSQEVLVFAKG